MEERSEAFEASQPERSREVRDEQPWNMKERFEVSETSSFERSMLLQFERLLNIAITLP